MIVNITVITQLILLYFFYSFNIVGKSIKDFNCPCGVDKNNYPDEHSYKKEVLKELNAAAKKQGESHNRIIGGTKSKYAVAWMALLTIKVEGELAKRRCGAVLINSKFLLTAAHCVCNPKMKLQCKLSGGVWRNDYNITKQIEAHINMKTIYDYDKMSYASKNLKLAIAHKKFLTSMNVDEYDKNKDGPYDIAVIKLMDRINTHKKPKQYQVLTMPICLPTASFKDTGIAATVAGYGVSDNLEKECITNDKGPDVFTRCSRKYKKGKISQNEYNSMCDTVKKPPSRQHKICNIYNYNKKKGLPKEEAILIPKNKQKDWDNNDPKLKGLSSMISCFPRHGEFGWCKTCNNKAANNKPGFCDPNEYYDKNDNNVPISKFDSGWGFCTAMCHTSMQKADATTRLNVYVLTETECREMLNYYKGERQNINTALQLCAGVKLNLFPVYYHYKKIPGKKKYKFIKIPEGKEPKYPKQKRLTEEDGLDLPFHIGGKDSCKGDSGGPLWTIKNKRSYLVGLVSFGTGCAEINRPGVYCRIKHKLSWIYKWAKSGACTKSIKRRRSSKKKKHKKKRKKRKKKRKHDYSQKSIKRRRSSEKKKHKKKRKKKKKEEET